MRVALLSVFAAFSLAVSAAPVAAAPITLTYVITGGTSPGGKPLASGLLVFSNQVSAAGCTGSTLASGNGLCLKTARFTNTGGTGGTVYSLATALSTPPVFWKFDAAAIGTVGIFHTFFIYLSTDDNISPPNANCCSLYLTATESGVLSGSLGFSGSLSFTGQEVNVPEPGTLPLLGSALALFATFGLMRAHRARQTRQVSFARR